MPIFPHWNSGRWRYPLCFVATMATLVAAQGASRLILHEGLWSWYSLTGAAFQAALLIGAFLFCSKPSRFLSFLFLIEVEILVCDALKAKYLGSALLPGDLLLLPELLGLIHTLSAAKQAGFYALMAILPLTLLGAALALAESRRWPRAVELAWLLPLVALTSWLVVSPGTYRRSLARMIGDEPIQARVRGQKYGRVLNLSMELARILEEYGRKPSLEEVDSARQYFTVIEPHSHGRAPAASRAAAARGRNIYILLMESFWDPGLLLKQHAIGGTDNFLVPEFNKLWTASGASTLFSPVYGGGTANTEFELLCGVPAAAAGEGILFMEALSNPMPCLPRLARDAGYHSFAFHPNKPGYYNRQRQFPAIGFERFFSIDDFRTDQMSGPFLGDDTFIRQSIEMARKNSGGKPYLAYMMTMAGHWPYPWSESLHKRIIRVKGEKNKPEVNEQNDELERELNINLYTSALVARAIQTLLREDPKAYIVVAGDHLPTTARPLAFGTGARRTFLTEPVWYETPLLIIDGASRHSKHASRTPRQPETLAAFEIGNRVLDAIGVPRGARAQFQYFGRYHGDLVRSVAPGKIFRLHPDGGFELCDSASTTASCTQQVEWFKQARALGVDLIRGKQYTLAPPSIPAIQPGGSRLGLAE